VEVSYYEDEDHFRDGGVLFLWRRTLFERGWLILKSETIVRQLSNHGPDISTGTFILREVYLPDISQDHSLLDQFYNAENNFNSNQPNNPPFKRQAMFLT
jgi:hypothetical protein